MYRFGFCVVAFWAAIGGSALAQTPLAFFDFNNGFAEADDSPQIVHPATLGSGTLYQQRADTDGNGKGGIAFVDAGLGINAAADRAFAWNDIGKSGDNDAEFFIETSTLGFENINLRFDVQGNATDPTLAYDLKFDPLALQDVTNPGDVVGTIKDFAGGTSTEIFNNAAFANAIDDNWYSVNLDLSAITGLNDQNVVAIRFDDFDGNNALRFDNVLVTGTAIAVPEPTSVMALAAIGGVMWRRRRRG